MPQIKQITVEYAYTFNLGNYSNVKPTVTLTAELSEGDDPELVILDLQKQARLAVQEEIDATLIANGRLAQFKRVEVKAKEEAPAKTEDEAPF